MNNSIVVKILPFAFAIHNFEEAWAICNTHQIYHNPFIANSIQFIIAVSLFVLVARTSRFCAAAHKLPDFKERFI